MGENKSIMYAIVDRKGHFTNQQGFTLIEMMVTIAIGGILLSIAAGSWNNMRENTRVDSAKEHVVSILQQARLKALSSGLDQTVDVKASTDIINDALGQDNNFSLDRVNVQKFACNTCTASDPVSDLITFKRRGTSVNKNIMVSSPGSNRSFIIMVNNVTGRIDVRTRCVVPNCLP